MIRKSIDELEVLTPDQLGEMLDAEIMQDSPDVMYIQDLLDVGCPINYKDQYDRTALHWAACFGHLEIAEFLISRGALIDARDNIGWTALHFAAQWGHLEVVKLLVSKGADVHKKNNKNITAWYLVGNRIREACPELEPR